jgi:hypothetical protein
MKEKGDGWMVRGRRECKVYVFKLKVWAGRGE